MRIIHVLVSGLLALILATNLYAQEGASTTKGHYQVFHSVFNSSFLQPDIAKAYNLIRAKDQAFINVVVTDKNHPNGLGKPVEISGYAVNLMQQQRKLEFVEIREKDTVYYLAPVRFTNEEVMHFNVNIKPSPSEPAFDIKLSKTLYLDP